VGETTAPGDKSISHRALMFGALAVGETRIEGMLTSEDIAATAAALRAYGAEIYVDDDHRWHVHGVGVGGFRQPDNIIDLGNSGTSARLLMGLAASQPVQSVFTGDASLRGRPMGRVITPLTLMGGEFIAREDGLMPITVIGATDPLPIIYELPVASAQVKSAVMLAGLAAAGETTVIEPIATRDHSEHMLRHFGADIRVEDHPDGGKRIIVVGQPELTAADVRVPGDPSSAAFPLAAAAICEGSDVTLRNVGLNPLRAGFIDCLREMGANIELINECALQGEPVADIRLRYRPLHGIEVPTERAPSMIDEYPILAMVACFAEGRTVMRGAEEMRVKESDRIDAVCTGLRALKIAVEEHSDGMTITGSGVLRSHDNAFTTIESRLDHRIAMSFAVLGLARPGGVRVDDGRVIDTSFPGFCNMMHGLGADMKVE